MKQSTKIIISLIIRVILLTLFGLTFAGFAACKLPNWCSPWWILVFYILYVINVLHYEIKLKK